MDVTVIGAGVSGLTTAIVLAESGHRVMIWARELPARTTSAVAAAIWYPYKAEPEEAVQCWGMRTLAVLTELAEQSNSGVLLTHGRKLFHRRMGPPWWRSHVRDFQLRSRHELPPGFLAGYEFTIPIADTSFYLDYLVKRLERAGGRIQPRTLHAFDEAFAVSDIVVNCTGLGARELTSDCDLFPIRGQVLRVRAPEVREFLLDSDNPDGIVYIIPRREDCILGGTAEDGEWDTETDPAKAQAIWQRCVGAFPNLEMAQVLEVRTGLRPGRSRIRLEAEQWAPGKWLVHNYGHGGSGITLSWGCAEAVRECIALEILC